MLQIGNIEICATDILRRQPKQKEFNGGNENHMVFTMQKKGPVHKELMCHLKGVDIVFNKWPVPGLGWNVLLKVPSKVYDAMVSHLIDDDRQVL